MKSHQPKPNTETGATVSAPLEVLGEIPLASIRPSPTNPRKHFDAAEIAGLAKSIEAHGLLQRIIVRPLPDDSGNQPQFFCGKWSFVGYWEIIAGERRFRAVKKLGWSTMPVVVRQMSDSEVLAVQLVENLQRADISPIEFARSLKKLRAASGKTLKQLGQEIGKSEAVVRAALLLVDDENPPELVEAIEKGWVLPSVGEIIARLPAGQRTRALTKVTKNLPDAMSFRKAKEVLGPKTVRIGISISVDDGSNCCPKCGRAYPSKPQPAKVQASAARKTTAPKKVVDDELPEIVGSDDWRSLPISQLDLAPRLDAHLAAQGIETLGQLHANLDEIRGLKPAEVERLRVLVEDAREGNMPYKGREEERA